MEVPKLYIIIVILFSSSAKAIDEYATLRSKAAESNDEAAKVDPRLEAIVERMLNKYVFVFSLISTRFLLIMHNSCSNTVFLL